jgi:hypothetical protein
MSEYRDSDVKVEGFNLTRKQVLEIHCQDCGAKPGERCETSSGRVRHDPHFLRKADRHDGIDPGPKVKSSNIKGPDGREWTWEQVQSWVISLSVRNALEMFHGGGAMDPENPNPEDPDEAEGFITDRQMKALNIVIRHTVSEAVSRLENPGKNAQELYYTLFYINKYMEPPGSAELEAAYEKIKNGEFDPPGFIPDCTRSEPLELAPPTQKPRQGTEPWRGLELAIVLSFLAG